MERLRPDQRLRRRKEYLACYRQGRRFHCQSAVLHVVRRDADRSGPRLGITASRKVGGAVVRNRLKRRVREIFRRSLQRGALEALDIVVHCRKEAAGLSFHDLERDLEAALRRIARRR